MFRNFGWIERPEEFAAVLVPDGWLNLKLTTGLTVHRPGGLVHVTVPGWFLRSLLQKSISNYASYFGFALVGLATIVAGA